MGSLLKLGRWVAPIIAKNFPSLFTGWTLNELVSNAKGDEQSDDSASSAAWGWSAGGFIIGFAVAMVPLLLFGKIKR